MQLALQIKEGSVWKTLNVATCKEGRSVVTHINLMTSLVKKRNRWEIGLFPTAEYRVVRLRPSDASGRPHKEGGNI